MNKYLLMSLAGNAIFGFSFLFSKIAFEVAEPFVLLAVRFTIAFILLNVIKALNLMPYDLKHKDIKPLILLGLIQPVAYFICESYGVKLTSSSFAGVIIALLPVVGLIPAALILKEKPSLFQVFCSIVSVIGVIVLTINDEFGTFSLPGLLFLLGSVFAAMSFNILGRSMIDKYTAFEKTYVMFGVSMIVFVLMALVQVGSRVEMWIEPLKSVKFWISVLYLSSISSVGAFYLINKSLEGLEVTKQLVSANITTVISVLAGIFILHEQFSFIQIIGIVMVVVGVYGVNVKK